MPLLLLQIALILQIVPKLPSTSTLKTLLNSVVQVGSQTTLTVCSNGQCFQIGTQAFASNLGAIGVSVTSIDFVVVKPICLGLLGYTVYSVWRQNQKWFSLACLSALLIIIDNYLLELPIRVGLILGNLGLLYAAIRAGREEQSLPE
jgi:hypothetical protein